MTTEHFIDSSLDHSSQTCHCGKRNCPELAPATVGGVTAKDIEPILNSLTFEWTNGPHWSQVKRATDAILALFRPHL